MWNVDDATSWDLDTTLQPYFSDAMNSSFVSQSPLRRRSSGESMAQDYYTDAAIPEWTSSNIATPNDRPIYSRRSSSGGSNQSQRNSSNKQNTRRFSSRMRTPARRVQSQIQAAADMMSLSHQNHLTRQKRNLSPLARIPPTLSRRVTKSLARTTTPTQRPDVVSPIYKYTSPNNMTRSNNDVVPIIYQGREYLVWSRQYKQFLKRHRGAIVSGQHQDMEQANKIGPKQVRHSQRQRRRTNTTKKR